MSLARRRATTSARRPLTEQPSATPNNILVEPECEDLVPPFFVAANAVSAAITSSRFGCMLPLLFSSRPRGASWLKKRFIGCDRSTTPNASRIRRETYAPSVLDGHVEDHQVGPRGKHGSRPTAPGQRTGERRTWVGAHHRGPTSVCSLVSAHGFCGFAKVR